MREKRVLLVDTTVIIEAHKLGCWKGMLQAFQVETVEQCVEEIATGDLSKEERVGIDTAALRAQVVVHSVEKPTFAGPALRSEVFNRLDPGEKELLAHASSRTEETWVISSQDALCVRAGKELGMLERFVSFEEAMAAAGVNKPLKRQFTRKWLEELRTKLFLGVR